MQLIDIKPNSNPVQRSFIIYGDAKAGKTSLALSVAELGKTLYLAIEKDGWQDVYETLSPKAKENLSVATLDSLQDIKSIAESVKKLKPNVIIVDSFTALMGMIESEIKALGGKGVVAGVTTKLSLNSYGDLANLAMTFVRDLKATGKHLILTAGVEKEKAETDEGSFVKHAPLMVGSKTATQIVYEVRAIGYLRAMNGKRELFFRSSQQWLAGSNYPSLTDAGVVVDPTFAKIFSLFPKPKKDDKQTVSPSEPTTDANESGPSDSGPNPEEPQADADPVPVTE